MLYHLTMLAAGAINLLFILLFLIGAFIQFLAKKSKETKEQSQEREEEPPPGPPSTRPMTAPSMDTDAERIRKFLEALGQPPSATPPPPVKPRTDVPPRPVAPVQPPRTVFPTPPRRVRQEEYRRKAEEPRRVFTPQMEEPTTPAPMPVRPPAAAYPVSAESIAGETKLAQLLHSQTGLRYAVILREVLGPPRSLQPLDLVGL